MIDATYADIVLDPTEGIRMSESNHVVAVVGLLVGWLLGVFTLVEPLVPAIVLGLWGVVIGGVIGANAGLVCHALTGGRRDFSSSRTLRAQRYDLVADAEVAVKARRLLTDARVVSPGAG